MVLFTFREIFDLLVMTLALGYVFMHSIPKPRTPYQMLTEWKGFDWESFKFAIYVTAPAIVLHEMMHKFVALFFGLKAVFHAWYFGLFLGIFLKIVHSPLILFAPGYVSISDATPLLSAVTAFAGPAMNLILYLVAWLILERAPRLTQKQAIFFHLTKQINLFLFIFNMLPIPPLDGSKVFYGLFQTLF
jgi:Zn-dependent protease